MTERASTSAKFVPVGNSEGIINKIKSDLKKQSNSLRKMHGYNSVEFITRAGSTIEEVLKFYSEGHILFVSTEGFKLKDLMQKLMEIVKPAFHLSELSIQFGETKKVFDNLARQFISNGAIKVISDKELEGVRYRAQTKGNDCMNNVNLRIKTAADLKLGGIRQLMDLENARLEVFKTDEGNEELNEEFLSRINQSKEAILTLDTCRASLKIIRSHISFSHKMKRTQGPGQDGTAGQLIVALNEFQKKFRQFTLKFKTKDPTAKDMLKAFGKYQDDIKCLINYYKESAKIYKFGTQDLVRLCKQLSWSVDMNLEELTLLSMGMDRIEASTEELKLLSQNITRCQVVLQDNARFLSNWSTAEDVLGKVLGELII
ncbi:unnamed protein product [Caenorhabditis brenneri]